MLKPDAEGIVPNSMSGVMPPASIIAWCIFSIKVKCLRHYRSPALQWINKHEIVQGILQAWQRFAYDSNSNDYKSGPTGDITYPD